MDVVLYTNDDLAQQDLGWEVRDDCKILMRPTRGHTLEEYKQQLGGLDEAEGAIQFWKGDVANAGKEEHGYGAMQKIAEDLNINKKLLWDYAWVSRQTTSSREEVYPHFPGLSHKHYKTVASLDPEEQVEALMIAGEEGMSVSELRAHLNGQDWQPRYFNHWSAFPIESWQNKYPGQIPGEILKNILYYTTEEGDFVIDVFGGGGNMGLACDRMNRKHVAYDINPQFPNIKKHNALYPFLDGNADLVFLDPPYWGQKRGEYDDDLTDLSNIPTPEQFHKMLKSVCDNANEALKPGGYMVLIIGSSQNKDSFVDHAAEMYSLLKDEWTHVNSVAAAYPTTQYSGNDVERAKKNKYMLNLYTTIQFWKC